MSERNYQSMNSRFHVNRRDFIKTGSIVGTGLLLGTPSMWAQEKKQADKPKTNIDEALKIPRTKHSLPGPFPGKVIKVHNPNAMTEKGPVADVIFEMFDKGLFHAWNWSTLLSRGLKRVALNGKI